MPGACIQVAMPTRTCMTTPVPTASFTAPAGTPLPGTASRRAIPISTTPTTSWTAVQPQPSHIGSWSMSGRKDNLKTTMTRASPTAATAIATSIRIQTGGRGRTGWRSSPIARRRLSGMESVLTTHLPAVRRAVHGGSSARGAIGPWPCRRRYRGSDRPPRN